MDNIYVEIGKIWKIYYGQLSIFVIDTNSECFSYVYTIITSKEHTRARASDNTVCFKENLINMRLNIDV